MFDEILDNIDPQKRRRSGIFEVSRQHYKLSVEPAWQYFSLFRLLQISPSYWMMHQSLNDAVKVEDLRFSDMDVVRTTYESFGPVWEIPFWEWWFERAQYQFAADRQPSVHLLGATRKLEHVSKDVLSELVQSAVDFYGTDLELSGQPGTLLLAVPTSGRRQDILKQVAALLDQHAEPATHVQPTAKFKILKNKLRREAINTAIRVVQAKAALPGKKLHEIGQRAKVGVSLDMTDRDHKRAVAMQTSRHILHAHRLSENAARGKFPMVDAPSPETRWPDVDFQHLGKLLDRYASVSSNALRRIPKSKQTSEYRYAGRNRKLWPEELE